MIKMSDVYAIDAGFENMEISLFGEKSVLLGTVRCFDVVQFREQYSEITRYFMESLEGKKINIHLPSSPNISPAKKSYGSGNLFMEFSSREKL